MAATVAQAWEALAEHHKKNEHRHLREMFADDPVRAESLSLSFENILFDFSKQRITNDTLDLLVRLAEVAGVPEKIQHMFSGERINITEDRSVLHVALRHFSAPFPSVQMDVMPEVLATRSRMA